MADNLFNILKMAKKLQELEGLSKANQPPAKSLGTMTNQQPLRTIADNYNHNNGLPKINHKSVLPELDPSLATKLAQAHTDMQHTPNNPETKAAYNALAHETLKQYNHLIDAGFKFTPMATDQPNPYPTSKEMFQDVHQNKHLYYFPTSGGFGSGEDHSNHPLLQTMTTKDGKNIPANDIFRAVHDVFGHAKELHGFGPRGEEAAWQHHMQMFSPLAQKALTSETRLQNHWVNWGPHSAHNKANPGQTVYAPQKAGLPPDWALTTQHSTKSHLDKSNDKIPGGKGDKKKDSDFDKKEVAMGHQVESEHTSSPSVAAEITRDHLSENPQYYSKLKETGLADELEKGLKGDWQKEGYEIKHEQPYRNKGWTESIAVVSLHGKDVARFKFGYHKKDNKLNVLAADVHPDHQRKGIASEVYRRMEEKTGLKMTPTPSQTEDAKQLWSQPNRPFGKHEELEKGAGRIAPKDLVGGFTRPDQQVKQLSGVGPTGPSNKQMKQLEHQYKKHSSGFSDDALPRERSTGLYMPETGTGFAHAGQQDIIEHEGYHAMVDGLKKQYGIPKVFKMHQDLLNSVDPRVHNFIHNVLLTNENYNKLSQHPHISHQLVFLEEKINVLRDFVHGTGDDSRRTLLTNALKDPNFAKIRGFKNSNHMDTEIKKAWKIVRDKANKMKPEDL